MAESSNPSRRMRIGINTLHHRYLSTKLELQRGRESSWIRNRLACCGEFFLFHIWVQRKTTHPGLCVYVRGCRFSLLTGYVLRHGHSECAFARGRLDLRAPMVVDSKSMYYYTYLSPCSGGLKNGEWATYSIDDLELISVDGRQESWIPTLNYSVSAIR